MTIDYVDTTYKRYRKDKKKSRGSTVSNSSTKGQPSTESRKSVGRKNKDK